jgi:hypothetical protein
MPEPIAYEVVIRGRASARILRPLVDDFTVDHGRAGTTRLLGEIRDASHLHGVMVHLTSVGAEVISIAPIAPVTPVTANPDLTAPIPDGATRAPDPRGTP